MIEDAPNTARWAVAICPNPRCHRPLVRMIDVVLEGDSVLEFVCRHTACKQRSVLGKDPECPPRPQAIVKDSMEAYRAYRESARSREDTGVRQQSRR